MRSDNPFKDWRTEGAEIILEPFDIIHQRAFPLINLLSKSESNWWGSFTTSALNCSIAEATDMDDSEDIPYSQQYLVATSTRIRVYR